MTRVKNYHDALVNRGIRPSPTKSLETNRLTLRRPSTARDLPAKIHLERYKVRVPNLKSNLDLKKAPTILYRTATLRQVVSADSINFFQKKRRKVLRFFKSCKVSRTSFGIVTGLLRQKQYPETLK